MANIQVTGTANCINVVFNDMALHTKFLKANFDLHQVSFQLEYPKNYQAGDDADYVRVFNKCGAPWCVTYASNPKLVAPNIPMLQNGSSAIIIDTVNNAAASSNDQLYEQLIALKS